MLCVKLQNVRWIVLLVLTLGLNACTFTVVPLIPTPVRLEPRLVIAAGSGLSRAGPEIVLRLELSRVPNEGYISVFLYQATADGLERQVAEDSRWVDGQTRSLEWPLANAVLGRYRALVFWNGSVERQFELVLE